MPACFVSSERCWAKGLLHGDTQPKSDHLPTAASQQRLSQTACKLLEVLQVIYLHVLTQFESSGLLWGVASWSCVDFPRSRSEVLTSFRCLNLDQSLLNCSASCSSVLGESQRAPPVNLVIFNREWLLYGSRCCDHLPVNGSQLQRVNHYLSDSRASCRLVFGKLPRNLFQCSDCCLGRMWWWR